MMQVILLLPTQILHYRRAADSQLGLVEAFPGSFCPRPSTSRFEYFVEKHCPFGPSLDSLWSRRVISAQNGQQHRWRHSHRDVEMELHMFTSEKETRSRANMVSTGIFPILRKSVHLSTPQAPSISLSFYHRAKYQGLFIEGILVSSKIKLYLCSDLSTIFPG